MIRRRVVQIAIGMLAFGFVLSGAVSAAAGACIKPTLSVEVLPADASGLITMYIRYENAGTISVYWRGVTEHLPAWSNPSPIKHTINASCAVGPSPLAVFAEACRGTPDAVSATPFETMISLDVTPVLSIAPRGDTTSGGFQRVEIDYKFPYTVYGYQRELSVELLPNDQRTAPSLVYLLPDGWFSASREGRASVPISGLATGTVLVRAVSCSQNSAVKVLPLAEQSCEDCGKPPSCRGCVGHPVRTSSGNMRYVEADPLPPVGGMSLRRTYDSVKNKVGMFGRGWRSIFDSVVTLSTASARDGSYYATVTTEEGVEHVFRRDGAAYTQVMPKEPGRATQFGPAEGGWVHRSTDGRIVRLFDGQGRLSRLTDSRTGRWLEVVRNASGAPARVVDSRANTAWVVTTDASGGRINSITVDARPDILWTYGYSGDRLASVTSPVGLWRTYEYQSAWPTAAISVIRDGQGRMIEQHSYDNNNRATSSYGTDGEDIQSISYGLPEPNGTTGLIAGGMIQRTVVTKRSGAVETHLLQSFDGMWRPIQITGGCSSCGADDASFVYEANGNVSRSQDATGYITENTFSPEGSVLTATRTALRPANCDPAADVTLCRLTPRDLEAATLTETPATEHRSYQYDDPLWPQLTTKVGSDSVVVDRERRLQSSVYDARTGVAVARAESGWTGPSPRSEVHTETSSLYDGAEGAAFAPGGAFQSEWVTLPQPPSEVKTKDGPRTDAADVTTFVYYPVDASVPAPWRGRLAAVRNAAGHVTRHEAYDVFGEATRVVDANGVVTESTFDALGRLLTTTVRGRQGCDKAEDPLCGADLTTTRTWYGSGPMATERRPAGGVTVYTYDERSRVVTVSRGPATNDLRERMETVWDTVTGRKWVEKFLAFENGAWVVKSSESFAYDLDGELTSVNHPDGTSVAYSYTAGRLATARDERHTASNTFYDYDPAGRISAVRQTLAGAPGGEVATRYRYDVAGNLREVTDPNGNVTSYVYDDFGRMLRQTSPVTGVTDYQYDSAGNLLSLVDALGSTTRGYDVLGRLIRSVSTRGTESEAVEWRYDGASSGLGRLTSIVDPTGSTSYLYDRRGLLTSERKTIDGAEYVTRHRFDADGNRSGIVYPSGMNVTYGADHAGRPVSAAVDGRPLVTAATWLPFGPPTELRFANGTTRKSGYDQRYRMTSNELIGPLGAIVSHGYEFDGGSNVLRIEDRLSTGYDRTFGYDDLNRLTVANSGTSLWGSGSYSYDRMGNLLAKQLGTRRVELAYRGTTPMLVMATEEGRSRNVAYDALGNEIDAGGIVSTYGPRNLLSRHGALQHSFDGRGIRTVTAHPARVVRLNLPGTLPGGTSASGEVLLSSAAGSEGVVVQLSSDHPAVVVPASIAIAAGATAAPFELVTSGVATAVPVTVTARLNGTVQTTITLVPAHLVSIALQPSSLTGGERAVGVVTLHGKAAAGGTAIALTSTAAEVTVPDRVTVAEGSSSATFEVATNPVATASTARIVATLAAESREVGVTVQPPTLTALVLDPQRLQGGSVSVGSITLNGAAPAPGSTVALSDDSPDAEVQASVTVAAGSHRATFPVRAMPVETETTATVRAVFGAAEIARFLTIVPPALTDLAVAPATIVGGEALTATVSLDAPAATNGSPVEITSSSETVEGSTIVVPGGDRTASHALRTAPVGASADVLVTASRQGVTRSASVRLEPPPVTLAAVALSPASVVGSNAVSCTVTLTDRAPAGGLEIDLLSSDPVVAPVPPAVLVPAGSSQLTFPIETSIVSSTVNVTITAAHGVAEQRAVLSVEPPRGNYVTALAVAPAFIAGGASAAGKVVLASPSSDKGGSDVVLTSSDPATVAVPATVRVKPKDIEATFTVGTTTVSVARRVVVSASMGGVITSLPVIVAPENAVTVAGLAITPARIASGGSATATVTLSGPAPHGGAVVTIEAGRRNIVVVPVSVMVPEGSLATSFQIVGETVHGRNERSVEIEATYNGIAVIAVITVEPPARAASAAPAPPIQCASASLAPCLTSEPNVPRTTTASVGGYARSYSFYTPELNLMAESEVSSGAAPRIAHEYIWFAGQPIAQVDHASSTVAWTFTDHLGTPLLQTDATGTVIWRAEYEPYGDVYAYRAGADRHQPLRFPGQEANESELAYNIFRWYRAEWGRYTQPDPIGVVAADNLYSYVDSSPGDAVDPLGLWKVHGNWCGPNWTGGYKKSWSELSKEQRKKALPPVDALDNACKDHDICYDTCRGRFLCDGSQRRSCFKSCDRTLSTRAYAAGGTWGNRIGSYMNDSDPGSGANDPTCPCTARPPSSSALGQKRQWSGAGPK